MAKLGQQVDYYCGTCKVDRYHTVAAVSPDRAGAADVSFISGIVPNIIDGIGLMGHDDHSPMETADLATLPSQTKRAAILLHRLTQSKR